MDDAIRKSGALIEALPYIKAFKGRFVVIKLGGSAQSDPGVLRGIFADIDFMLSVGMRPIVVYGGGKRISAAMEATGQAPVFIEGQRVTDPATMEIVARVLIDEVGSDLLQRLEECGGQGEIRSGRGQGFSRAVKKTLPTRPEADLGCVGEPVAIDAVQVYSILERGRLPLIAPVACGCGSDQRTLYNINGDTASALIARDLHAEKLVFLSDIPGIYADRKDPASLLSHMTVTETHGLMDRGAIEGGMIPKVQACAFALDGGVRKVHIVSGAQAHALLLEIFTQRGVGTELVL